MPHSGAPFSLLLTASGFSLVSGSSKTYEVGLNPFC